NCDSVELFQDGQSLGNKPHAAGEVVTWPIEFTSGELKAVGRKGNSEAVFELKKAGAAAKLAIKPDVTSLAANGRDVAQVEIDVTDTDGTLVPEATNRVTCAITGPGRILGIENGDIRSTEDYSSMSRQAYQGRLMIYLRAGKSAGELKL